MQRLFLDPNAIDPSMANHSAHDNAPRPAPGAQVRDAAGHRASIVAIHNADSDAQAAIRLEDGSEMLVPTALLAAQPDGGYRLPFSIGALRDTAGNPQLHIPVVQEALQVDKRAVDTGRGVRLHKTVSEHEQRIDVPLQCDELDIEHVAIGQVVAESALPRTRQEGDTLVVPVLEEVLVVQKQLVLKEELRITRRRTQTHASQNVVLKSEQVTAERFDDSGKTPT
jgi:uncharacterized protein (TIGR02271 family)